MKHFNMLEILKSRPDVVKTSALTSKVKFYGDGLGVPYPVINMNGSASTRTTIISKETFIPSIFHESNNYLRFGKINNTSIALDNWESIEKIKKFNIAQEKKKNQTHLKGYSELSEQINATQKLVEKSIKPFQDDHRTSTDELLEYLNKLTALFRDIEINNFIVQENLHFNYETFKKKLDDDSERTDRLLSFIKALRRQLNKVSTTFRINKRYLFRKINSFFFKNLDDSHLLNIHPILR